MSKLTLYMGNKNYSSWSIRPWAALEHIGAPFEEVIIRLDEPDTAQKISAVSGAGRVPVLKDGDLVIWDSLAILEYLAERFPDAKLWPEDVKARAVARSVSAEMHSGFTNLRNHMSMNFRAHKPGEGRGPGVDADIARITSLWADCRARFGQGGPFLFGRFSIADCMFAPVVSRFTTYEVLLEGEAKAYADAIRALPLWKKWADAARAEPPVKRYEK